MFDISHSKFVRIDHSCAIDSFSLSSEAAEASFEGVIRIFIQNAVFRGNRVRLRPDKSLTS